MSLGWGTANDGNGEAASVFDGDGFEFTCFPMFLVQYSAFLFKILVVIGIQNRPIFIHIQPL
jgi:hypothetical protein